MNVNGLNIRENINLEDGQMSIEVPIGQVDPNAPNEALRAWWNPVDWVCWVEDKISSAANTVFDTVSSVFGVKKHDAEYLLLTKTGQVLRGDFDCILEGIELGLFENIRNNNGFQFWHCNEDVLNRRMRILNNEMIKKSADPEIIAKREQTRLIGDVLASLIAKVGGIVITKVKEMVTLQAGGRYDLNDTGYWFFKHGDETVYVLNDYTEQDELDKVGVDLHQGDCYMWFGLETDLRSIGLGDYQFSCSFDKNYNICFNTPFGGWTLATGKFIEGVVKKVIDWGKCVFQKINNAIWKFFSYFVGDRSYVPNSSRAVHTINYPGLTLVHPIIGDTEVEQRRGVSTLEPPFQF